MKISELIIKKTNHEKLTKDEIDFFVQGSVKNQFSESEIVEMIKAIFDNSLSNEETTWLTESMVNSGDMLDFGDKIVLDKHSTGGVSDTTTLIIVPILASLGYDVAKISGKALGHTGGTVDKLQVLEGIELEKELEEIKQLIDKNHACILSQSKELVPADKLFYALRHKNNLVASVPLIASSVVSKKIASGAKGVVFDVKCGEGAFMQNEKDAFVLAKLMHTILTNLGIGCTAIISDMNQPLGHHVGCNLEFIEAMQVLNGKEGRLKDLSIMLAYEMIRLVNKTTSKKVLFKEINDAIANKTAFKSFINIAVSQGAKKEQIENYAKLPLAKNTFEVLASNSGYVSKIDTFKIGEIVAKLSENVDKQVGLIMQTELNEKVAINKCLMTVYYNDASKFEKVKNELLTCIEIGKKLRRKKLIKRIIR